jgi:hypothetical protein
MISFLQIFNWNSSDVGNFSVHIMSFVHVTVKLKIQTMYVKRYQFGNCPLRTFIEARFTYPLWIMAVLLSSMFSNILIHDFPLDWTNIFYSQTELLLNLQFCVFFHDARTL